MLSTPVAFIIFNRPDVTAKVFARIREVAPPRLYVIADGPRTAAERAQTDATRAVTDAVDWPCTVNRIYSDDNLGCRQRVVSGLNRVFELEERAIILEDDCLPDPSFFAFCETLLNRYEKGESIMHISGNNFQEGQIVGDGDYYFSRFSHIWGWATWRRAWKFYPLALHFPSNFFEIKTDVLFGGDSFEASYWKGMAEVVQHPGYSAWSFHWQFSIWLLEGKCILPGKNLVKNIGFGNDATHGKNEPEYYKKVKLESLHQYIPPGNLKIEYEADRRTFYKAFCTPNKKTSLFNKLKLKMKHLLK